MFGLRRNRMHLVLRERLQELGLDEDELSARADVDRGAVEELLEDDWGLETRSLAEVKRVLAVLGVDFRDLFDIRCAFCNEHGPDLDELGRLPLDELLRRRRLALGLSLDDLLVRMGAAGWFAKHAGERFAQNIMRDYRSIEDGPDAIDRLHIGRVRSLSKELGLPVQLPAGAACARCGWRPRASLAAKVQRRVERPNMDRRAALGFAAAAGDYAAYRPGYPPAAVAYVRETGRLDEASTVVDLAAGTGQMTRLLGPLGRLVAVEPVPSMRDLLRSRVADAEVWDGTAGSLPLPDTVADAVVTAQAFHWFASPEAVREIARVLKPAGKLFLVWNIRDDADPLMRGIDELLAPHRSQGPGYSGTPWREAFEREGSPLRLDGHQTFFWQEPLTLEQFRGRVRSASYVALLDEPAQAEVLRQLEELARSSGVDSPDAPVVMKYRTEVYVATR